jgi:t-SNARE complex subunit (syntaxin)
LIRVLLTGGARTVNPAVSEQEIKAAVDSSGPAANQIFAQALVGGSRTAAARSALDEAQTRRSELLRIEETLTELAALMQQVRARRDVFLPFAFFFTPTLMVD